MKIYKKIILSKKKSKFEGRGQTKPNCQFVSAANLAVGHTNKHVHYNSFCECGLKI